MIEARITFIFAVILQFLFGLCIVLGIAGAGWLIWKWRHVESDAQRNLIFVFAILFVCLIVVGVKGVFLSRQKQAEAAAQFGGYPGLANRIAGLLLLTVGLCLFGWHWAFKHLLVEFLVTGFVQTIFGIWQSRRRIPQGDDHPNNDSNAHIG